MKEQLDEASIRSLTRYRFERAKETLAEVPYLKEKGFYNTAVNRLYYACYYAAAALMIKHRLHPATHAGVKQMLGIHFVATGKLPREQGRNFSLLFERRHTSDYDDFSFSTEQDVADLYDRAGGFIHAIGKLLEE